MSENTVKSRIQLKNDTEENWKKAINFTPKIGEIVIYNKDETNDAPRIKVGDGTSNVNDLPFIISATFNTPEFVESSNEDSSAALTGSVNEYVLNNGKQILYFNKFKLPGTAITLELTLKNGETTTALPVYRYDTIECSIQYPKNTVIPMVFYNNAFYIIAGGLASVI